MISSYYVTRRIGTLTWRRISARLQARWAGNTHTNSLGDDALPCYANAIVYEACMRNSLIANMATWFVRTR